jgi:hypothetical protein
MMDLFFTWYYADTESLSDNEKANLKMAMKTLQFDVAGKYGSVVLLYGMFIPMKKFYPIYDSLFLITLFCRKYKEPDFWTTYIGD